MTGFPKTLTDFSLSKPQFTPKREWQKYLENQARSYLKDQDFFSKKTEDWRYFPFQKVMRKNFAFDTVGPSFPKQESAPALSPSLFISVKNGKIFPSFQQSPDIFLCSWKEFLLSEADINTQIKEKILYTLKKQRNPFCSLSNALYTKGMILVIKKKLKQPLEIHYTHSDKRDQQGLNLRNFIFVENKASAQILEVFYGRVENKPLFFNIQTDCFISAKSQLEHCRVDQVGDQDIVINQLFAELSKGAKAGFFSLSLNAGISRWLSQLDQDEKSTGEIRGLSLLKGNQYADHKATASHRGIEGISRQLYRSFLFDSAKQIFQGFISIEKQAQRSDASQSSKNFLFGKRAFAVACPELDISADDVKASHGATLSPFTENRDLMFYLQSRGIDPLQAFHLIVSGLMKETFSGLQSNTKEFMQALIQKKLGSLENSIKDVFS